MTSMTSLSSASMGAQTRFSGKAKLPSGIRRANLLAALAGKRGVTINNQQAGKVSIGGRDFTLPAGDIPWKAIYPIAAALGSKAKTLRNKCV
jgi:hypothetical protein